MLAPDTVLQSRYRIVRQLGQGGMGAVYEAIDQRLKSLVAVKEMLVDSDSMREAFEHEASLLANLNHPALPKVTDHFTEGNGQFLAMQFVKGNDLAKLLAEKGAFSQTEVCAWADQLLDALDYLHGHEPPVLHRDIKPANIKLGDRGHVILLDFGLAKGALGQMSAMMSKSVFGYTPVYAPLEQILGQGTDARSDLYSLGATLYHLLTGVAPIDAPSRFHAVEDEQADPLPAIEKINQQVSRNVAAVIHQAMAVSRKQRPTSAAEMRRALGDAVGEAAARAEEVRQLQEVGTRTKEEALPKQTALRLEGDERDRFKDQNRDSAREQDEQHRAPLSETVLGATVQAQEPAMKTLPPPASERVSFDQPSADAKQSYQAQPPRPRSSKRTIVVAAAVVALILGGLLVVWLLDRTSKTIARNNIGMELVYLPPGDFMMGSEQNDGEKPSHRVTISNGFYMGKYEVTQAQWQVVMGNNPSAFKDSGGNCPVEQVSWNDAQAFINKLNESNDGFKYRLPSEAEWEYACRAGTTGDYYAGDVADIGWYDGNSGNKTHSVGGKQPNAFGLYDMSGNVWEWCRDWYHDNYNGAPSDGSAWPDGGEQKYRVLRGGSWGLNAKILRSAFRLNSAPDYRDNAFGFRVVAVVRTQ